jgi:hypothetical protein
VGSLLIGWVEPRNPTIPMIAKGGDDSIKIKQAIERIEHLLVTNEFSDRVFDLRDGDTKKVQNLLAYRKVGLEGGTEEFWVPTTVFEKEFVVRESHPNFAFLPSTKDFIIRSSTHCLYLKRMIRFA